jgi:TolA protein
MIRTSDLKEEENKKRGLIISVIFHVLILVLLFLPLLSYPDPPPGQEGILVSFGQPNIGQGDSRPDTQQDEVVEPKPPSEEVQKTEVPPQASTPVETQKEVVTAKEPSEVSFKKQEEDKKKAEESERKRVEENNRKAAEEAERQRKADEAAKQAELDKAKKTIWRCIRWFRQR